jgi:hypothetical protein
MEMKDFRKEQEGQDNPCHFSSTHLDILLSGLMFYPPKIFFKNIFNSSQDFLSASAL